MGEIRNLSQLLNALKRGYTIKDGTVVYPAKTYAARKPEKAERHFCISVAGHVVGIDSMYQDVFNLCRNYLSEEDPEIQVRTEEMDLDAERMEAEQDKSVWQDGYLETLSIYRKVCEAMLPYDIFLMHGAVIALNGSAYMFTAESGTGKTTHIRKWLDRLEDAFVVNGDKPLIKICEKEVLACGTPWCGKEQMETNTMVPLKAIVIMKRGRSNQIEEISYGDAFSFLLRQTYQPKETAQKIKTLQLLSKMNGKVRFFRFVFDNMKADAFSVAYQALTGEKV